MKQCKKLTAFFLAFAMILSLAGSTGAKAATSMTVTLYVAQDSKVMIKPVTVTLTDADKKDFGVDLATDKLTPLHALAKYYQTVKNVSNADMKNISLRQRVPSVLSSWIQKTAEVLLLPVLTVFIGCGQKTVIMLW